MDMYRTDFADEKVLNKFIKSVELGIRHSPEYRMWVDYQKESSGYFTCSLTGEKHGEVTVDLHHHPYPLFYIAKGYIKKCVSDLRSFCSFDIEHEIVDLHYQMKIPFVPLCRTMHEKYHTGFLFLPNEIVVGDKDYFYTMYSAHLDDEEVNKINANRAITFANCGWTENQYQWCQR